MRGDQRVGLGPLRSRQGFGQRGALFGGPVASLICGKRQPQVGRNHITLNSAARGQYFTEVELGNPVILFGSDPLEACGFHAVLGHAHALLVQICKRDDRIEIA